MEKDHEDRNNKGKRKGGPRMSKKKLDSFLASICEAGGMTGKLPHKKDDSAKRKKIACQGPCEEADWRSHLDVPYGLLCVSASWSKNKHAEKHRDVTVALTYMNDQGKA